MDNYSEWTKRLGQQHWVSLGAPETLCGMPLLGNNYAVDLPDKDKVPCKECQDAIQRKR